jgi:hypothetical protein
MLRVAITAAVGAMAYDGSGSIAYAVACMALFAAALVVGDRAIDCVKGRAKDRAD